MVSVIANIRQGGGGGVGDLPVRLGIAKGNLSKATDHFVQSLLATKNSFKMMYLDNGKPTARGRAVKFHGCRFSLNALRGSKSPFALNLEQISEINSRDADK